MPPKNHQQRKDSNKTNRFVDAKSQSPPLCTLEKMALQYQYSNHDTTPGLKYESPFNPIFTANRSSNNSSSNQLIRPTQSPDRLPTASEYFDETEASGTYTAKQSKVRYTTNSYRIHELQRMLSRKDREIEGLRQRLGQHDATTRFHCGLAELASENDLPNRNARSDCFRTNLLFPEPASLEPAEHQQQYRHAVGSALKTRDDTPVHEHDGDLENKKPSLWEQHRDVLLNPLSYLSRRYSRFAPRKNLPREDRPESQGCVTFDNWD